MARGSLARRLLVAGAFVWVARWAVAQGEAKPAPIDVPDDVPEAAVAPGAPRHAFRKRFATSLAFATLFFAGAAFTAGAGNLVTDDSSPGTPAVVDTTATTDTTAATTDATATVDVTATVPAPAPDVVTEPAPVASTPAPADPAPALTNPAQANEAPPADSSNAILLRPSPSAGSPTPVSAASPPAVHAKRHAARHARRVVAAVSVPVRAASAPIPFQALAFDPQAWLHDNAASLTGVSAVALAEHYLGVPYVWGGAVPGTGFDCSGFTQFIYAQLGVTLPHYAASQFEAFAKLDPAELQPGDLVFFEPKFDGPGHVALYMGNDQMIEAPHTGALVRVSSFSAAAATMGFLGAVRPYTVVAQASAPPRASVRFTRFV